MKLGRATAMLGFLALIAPSSAHHSNTMFDTTKTIAVSGAIKDVQWTNPHCYLFVKQPLPGGGVKTWLLEAGPPSIMSRLGTKESDFVVGAQLSALGHPAKSGQAVIYATSLVMPDGRTLKLY